MAYSCKCQIHRFDLEQPGTPAKPILWGRHAPPEHIHKEPLIQGRTDNLCMDSPSCQRLESFQGCEEQGRCFHPCVCKNNREPFRCLDLTRFHEMHEESCDGG